MNLLFVLLIILMFVDCLILVLLVLAQLPKKEAGSGTAFGGGATDALFGAGSGNVLTKITKWAASVFFGLALAMAVIAGQMKKNTGGQSLTDALSRIAPAATTPAAAPLKTTPAQPLPLLSNVPSAHPVTTAPPVTAPAPAPATNK